MVAIVDERRSCGKCIREDSCALVHEQHALVVRHFGFRTFEELAASCRLYMGADSDGLRQMVGMPVSVATHTNDGPWHESGG